jgi:hypothetical protein
MENNDQLRARIQSAYKCEENDAEIRECPSPIRLIAKALKTDEQAHAATCRKCQGIINRTKERKRWRPIRWTRAVAAVSATLLIFAAVIWHCTGTKRVFEFADLGSVAHERTESRSDAVQEALADIAISFGSNPKAGIVFDALENSRKIVSPILSQHDQEKWAKDEAELATLVGNPCYFAEFVSARAERVKKLGDSDSERILAQSATDLRLVQELGIKQTLQVMSWNPSRVDACAAEANRPASPRKTRIRRASRRSAGRSTS